MSYKYVDDTKLDTALTETADAIREKLGSEEQIPFDYENGKGFAEAVEAIPQSGEPQWEDDDSPVVMDDVSYQNSNIHLQITEKGTLRWYRKSFEYDYMKYARVSWGTYNQLVNKDFAKLLPTIIQGEIVPCGRDGYEVQLGQYCFGLLPNLKVVKIPDTVTEIEKACFADSNAIEKIILPNGLTTLGTGHTFARCRNLKEVNIPNAITEIPSYCFSECCSLKHIDGFERFERIGANAFDSCVSLSDKITFNENLDKLEASVFRNCCSLTELEFKGKPESIGNGVFSNCNNITSIKVPWSEGEVAGAPWGATNATITYNYTGG